MVKIVADENIPLLEKLFGSQYELILKPGRDITPADVLDADILLTRSVTRVDQTLLQNSKVKFVGSTTTGSDHLDVAWLEQAGISWSVAEGCNATAVVEYVICVCAALQKMGYLNSNQLRAAVVGVGKIGSRVATVLKGLGFSVLLCDPLRAENEKEFVTTALDAIENVDLIALHTPLTFSDPYPTYHMIEKNFLLRQKKNCILLNTARGEVINSADLKAHGQHLFWCLDVWENEPLIDRDMVATALIATPHIAGYSVQSKYRGIEMIYAAVCAQNIISHLSQPQVAYPTKQLSREDTFDWQDGVLRIFNPYRVSQWMKQSDESFDQMRKNFQERHEFEFVQWCE